jgi:hypothetical protein
MHGHSSAVVCMPVLLCSMLMHVWSRGNERTCAWAYVCISHAVAGVAVLCHLAKPEHIITACTLCMLRPQVWAGPSWSKPWCAAAPCHSPKLWMPYAPTPPQQAATEGSHWFWSDEVYRQ